MKRQTLLAFAIAGLLALPGAASGHEPLNEAALDEYRGGLMTSTGLEIGFGALVRTFVDGQLALETQLTWTDQGAQTVQTLGASPGPGGWTELPSPTGGATSVMHDLSEGRIASIVINTANDRFIRQETDIALHLPQLAEMQQRMAAERVASILVEAAPR
jgi:hypothetical protein